MPAFRSERLVAQQGAFTICADIFGDHGELIAGSFGDQETFFYKFIIPAELKLEFLARLQVMNITAA